jgi:hypothetical protein
VSRKFLTPLVLPADPAVAMEAATKQYVDTRSAAPAGAIVATGYDTNWPTGYTTSINGTFLVKQINVSFTMSPTGPWRLRTWTSFWTAADSGTNTLGVTFDNQWVLDAVISPRVGPVAAAPGMYATGTMMMSRDFTYGQAGHYHVRNQIANMQAGPTAYCFFTTHWEAIRL